MKLAQIINKLRQFERCPALLRIASPVETGRRGLGALEFEADHPTLEPLVSITPSLYNDSLAFDRRKSLADTHDGDIRLVRRTDVDHQHVVLAGP